MIKQLLQGIQSALTWWVTVAPWEQAIRVRAGKHVRLLRAGIHARVPILDRVYRQSTRRRVTTLPPQTLTTKDGKSLTLGLTLGYRIVDLMRLYETLHHAEGTIMAMALGSAARFVMAHEAGFDPVALCSEVERGLGLERYGLADVDISLANHAVVRTYRFITGDADVWSSGADNLDTDKEWSPGGESGQY